MNKLLFVIALQFVLMSFNSCKNSQKGELKAGIWRATLKTQSGVEIPFNFEMIDSAGKKQLNIINGKEHLRVNEISFHSDSVIIRLPVFESEIKAAEDGQNLDGHWIKYLANEDRIMEFHADYGISWRFFKINTASQYPISGRWSVAFTKPNSKDTTFAIGEFKQDGNKLLGTFLTTSGDYRFLEGTVSDNKLYLSCFDGTHAYLFTGNLQSNRTITEGKFYSGLSDIQNWTATRDDKAMLPDAYSITRLKPGNEKIDFTFPDQEGRQISLADPLYQNKVVVVQLLGSWCPNCMDETAYLAPFYKKYKQKGVEVIGLAYELSTDFERSKRNIRRLRKRFDITYPTLITGYINQKEQVVKSLPMLNHFVAFPTTIMIDKKGRVRKIHTGFSGPGTGNHYTEFVEEFERNIDNLLAEK